MDLSIKPGSSSISEMKQAYDQLKANCRELEKQLEIQKNSYVMLLDKKDESNRKLFSIRAAIDMPELYLDSKWNVFGYSQNFLALTEKANEFSNTRGNLKDFLEEEDFEHLMEYIRRIENLKQLPYDDGDQWQLRYNGPNISDKIGQTWLVSLNCKKPRWKISNGKLIHEPHISDRVDCYLMTAKEYGGADEDIKVVYRARTSKLKDHISDMSLVISGSSGRNDILCDRIGYTVCTASNENSLARIQRKIADIVSYPEVIEPDTEYLIKVERTGGRITRQLKNLRTGEEAAPLEMIDSDAIYNYQNHIGFQTFSGKLEISDIEIYTRKSRFSIDQFSIPFDIEVGIRNERLKGRIFRLRMSQYTLKGEICYMLIFEDITERKKNEINLIREHQKLELSLKHQRLLADIASRLNSSESFRKVLGELFLKTGEVTELDCAAFYTIENEINKNRAVLLSSWCSDVCSSKGKYPPSEISITSIPKFGKLIKGNKRTVLLNCSDFECDGKEPTFCKDIKSILVSRLQIAGELRGFLCFARVREIPWKEEDINLFNAIADMLINTWERDLHFQARIKAEKKQTEAVQLVEKAAHMASIGVMAAGLTHEINQPLSSIKVTADSVLYWDKRNKGMLPEFFINKLEKISNGVKRINDIIQHMRSFWISPDQLVEKAINLNETVVSALSLIDHQLHAHEIESELILCGGELPIRGNPVHLEQIVINLVVNSIHALDELVDRDDKKITIRTRRANNNAYLQIYDNGIGLPKEAGNDIFDPFYTTRKPGEGTGLGLAIVKRFVEEHNGAIEVENNENGGATFRIKFPICKTSGKMNNGNSAR